MIKRLLFLAGCIALASGTAFAACPDTTNNAGYVLASASGAGTGADWTNAYTSFGTGSHQLNPAAMVRGCTYYVGVGNYNLTSQVVFSTAASGTTLITIQAPTIANHGTATGWSNAFVGQAKWACIGFTTDYWTFNGSYRGTGSGVPATDWRTGYGFAMYNDNGSSQPVCPSGDSATISIGAGGSGGTGTTIEYVDIHGSGDTTGTYVDIGIFGAAGPTNLTYQYNYIHNVGSCYMKAFAPASGSGTVLMQYNWGNNDQSTTANHGCGVNLSGQGAGGSEIATVRWNILENVEGTSYLDDTQCSGCSGSWYFYGNIFFTNTAEWTGNCNLCTPSTGPQDGLTYWIGQIYGGVTLTEYAFWNNTIYDIAPAGSAYPAGQMDWAISGSTVTNFYVQNNLYVNATAATMSLPSGTTTRDYNSYFDVSSVQDAGPGVQSVPGVIPFVDVAADNFNLTQETACWTPLPSPYNVDLLGHTRTCSRGALQFGGTSSPTFYCTPATVPAGHSTNIPLSCVGSGGIAWSGSTAFTVSGATLVSKTNHSATSETIVITTSSAGTATITDTSDSISATISVATATLSFSPTSAGVNTAVTLTMSGGNTLWQTATNPSPLFSVSGSGCSGDSLGTPSITSDTSATVVLNPGSAACTETITDNSTGATKTITVGSASGGGGTNFYVAQTAAGSGAGTSCANAFAVTFFNTSSNWGSGSGKIGPGTTVNLCGTITSQLTAQGSGISGNPVTIQWQGGAELSVCSTGGALDTNGESYLTIDLGGNAPAITCPNNGSSLSTQINAVGISGGSGMPHVEIRNGTIGPIYVHSGSDTNVTSAGILTYGATGIYFHNLTLDWAEKGIHVELGNGFGNSSGNVISYNYCTGTSGVGTTGGCIIYTSGDNAAHTDTGALIHDNSCVLGIGWAGSSAHITCFDFYQQSGAGGLDNILGLQIYNNFFTSSNVLDTSAYVELTDGVVGCSTSSTLTAEIFNNFFVQNGTWTGGDGFIFEHGCYHTDQIYNNTMVNSANTPSVCMSLNGPLDGLPGYNTFTVKNNICQNIGQPISNAINDSGSELTANNNIYWNSSGPQSWDWNGTTYSTFAEWQAACGCDANSSIANPGLNSSYLIAGTSSLAYQFGPNLTSLDNVALDIGAPQTFGPTGSCGTGCLGRAPTGNWDAGAYPFTGTSSGPPPTSGSAHLVESLSTSDAISFQETGATTIALAETLSTSDAIAFELTGSTTIALAETLSTSDSLYEASGSSSGPPPPPPAGPTYVLGDHALAAIDSCAFLLEIDAPGGGFTPETVVEWNGTALATTYVYPRIVWAAIPASELTVAGVFPLTATTPGTGTVALGNFTVVGGAPTISSTTQLGATFVVSGTNYVPRNTVVLWNGTTLQTTWYSMELVQAWLPPGIFSAGASPSITISNAGCESD
jgi:hypothetical protein